MTQRRPCSKPGTLPVCNAGRALKTPEMMKEALLPLRGAPELVVDDCGVRSAAT
jgi:hypothetical protein